LTQDGGNLGDRNEKKENYVGSKAPPASIKRQS